MSPQDGTWYYDTDVECVSRQRSTGIRQTLRFELAEMRRFLRDLGLLMQK